MTFAFSVKDVTNFIDGIGRKSSVVDDKIKSIESFVADYNKTIHRKLDPVYFILKEEKEKYPVLRKKFEEAEKKLKQAEEALENCPPVIWVTNYNNVGIKPYYEKIAYNNPGKGELAAEVEACQKKVKEASWTLQHCEDRIGKCERIIEECAKLEIEINIGDISCIKDTMKYELMDMERKVKRVLSYGEDVLSFNFSHNQNSKKYNLRIK